MNLVIRNELRTELKLKQMIQLQMIPEIAETEAGNDARLQAEILREMRLNLKQGIFVDTEDFSNRMMKRIPKKNRSAGVVKMVENIRLLIPKLELDLVKMPRLIEVGLGAFALQIPPYIEYLDLNNIVSARPNFAQTIFGFLSEHSLPNVTTLLKEAATDKRFAKDNAFSDLISVINGYSAEPEFLTWLCYDYLSLIPKGLDNPQTHSLIVKTAFDYHCWSLPYQRQMQNEIDAIRKFFTRYSLEALQEFSSAWPNIPRIYLVFLPEEVVKNQEAMQKFNNFCQSDYWKESTDVKRQYLCLGSIRTIERQRVPLILHLLKICESPRQLKKLLDILVRKSMVSKHGLMDYPFSLDEYDAVMNELENQETTQIFRNLPLDDDYQKRFNQATHIPPQLVKIIATLRDIYEQEYKDGLPVLAEITKHLIDQDFLKWRYGNPVAQKQLEVVGRSSEVWQKSSYEVKIIASQDQLAQMNGLIKQVSQLGDQAKVIFTQIFNQPITEELKRYLSKTLMHFEERFKQPGLTAEDKKKLGQEKGRLMRQYHLINAIDLFYITPDQIDMIRKLMESQVRDNKYKELHSLILEAVSLLNQQGLASLHSVLLVDTDSCLDLFEVGRIPILTCQRWTEKTSQNECLPAYPGDANKRLLLIQERIGLIPACHCEAQ